MNLDVRPAAPAADLSADRVAQLTAEVERLRRQVGERDRRIAELTDELGGMQRRVDDLLDRESMHVYDPDMERLTTAASLERLGAARARHAPVSPSLELDSTAAGLRWGGFDR
ncbi:hypothetical protein [Nocardia wallacei]|uniref:hypothetical protein n=1 Tax=Nocardia wallacei TaxID=480035 RepID=UPI00245559CB|nr:hypothetical protein [Nocardia wallacei]